MLWVDQSKRVLTEKSDEAKQTYPLMKLKNMHKNSNKNIRGVENSLAMQESQTSNKEKKTNVKTLK